MQISVKTDVKELTKSLNRIQRKQIPFATSKALNTVAFDVRKMLQDGLDIHLDRPTPYTKRGVQVEKSTKKKLVAEVGFRSKSFGKGKGSTTQASYMKRQIEGGTRKARSKQYPFPFLRTSKQISTGRLYVERSRSFWRIRINTSVGFQRE